MRRGEIYLADLGEPVGHEQSLIRPVLIVSAQRWLDSNPPVVTAVPLTRTHRDAVTHVKIEPGLSGLRATSYAKCEDVRSISPIRLGHRFGSAEVSVLVQIEIILRRLLAL